MDTRNDIALAISAATGMDAAELLSYIEIPPDSSMGDYAFPCFRLAKAMRKAPTAIAAELKDKLALPAGITSAEVAGGYLNFFDDRAGAAAATIMRVLNEGENYGHSSEGQGKNVCVEFSSINIAKRNRKSCFFQLLHGSSKDTDRISSFLVDLGTGMATEESVYSNPVHCPLLHYRCQ